MEHDPELFAHLHHLLVRRGIRKLSALKHLPLFAEFEFYGKLLPRTVLDRKAWFEHLLKRSDCHDLVFFDPDIGLEVPSVARNRKHANRYLYYDELAPFVTPNRVVLVYQHYSREQRPEYEARIAQKLRDRCRVEHIAVLRTSAVGFFGGYGETESNRIERSLSLLKDRWSDRFEVVRL